MLDLAATLLSGVVLVSVVALWLVAAADAVCMLHGALERALRPAGRGLKFAVAVVALGAVAGLAFWVGR